MTAAKLSGPQVAVLRELAKPGGAVVGSGSRWVVKGQPPLHGTSKAVYKLLILGYAARIGSSAVMISDAGRAALAALDAEQVTK